jgi:hypothetical protein
MYMRDPMHQIDSGVIISFLKAVLRKFRECVEFPLGIPGLGLQLRSLQTDCVDSSVKKKSLAAMSCTVPTRDYRHLMLLLPFCLSNLFREEVEEHNSTHPGAAVVDPSEELIGVTNVFLRWYKLGKNYYNMYNMYKTVAKTIIICIICIISIMYIITIIRIIVGFQG